MPAPEKPYQPYAAQHETTNGPGDSRPTALQVIEDCGMMGKLEGKTALITGCSSGIGIETARALYEAGAKLILTARDMAKLEQVIDDIANSAQHNKSGPRPVPIEMHLDSLEAVRKAAAEVKHKANGHLNLLVGNAGVMAVPLGKTIDGFETHMAVNHFAHFLLFQELKPLLLQSAKATGTVSRVICVTSAGHCRSGIRFDDMNWDKNLSTYEPLAGYCQSKTANVYIANSITRHYGDKGILAWSVHPGAIPTELSRYMTTETWAALGDMSRSDKIIKSPEQGAATTVWAAVSPYFEGENGGRYLSDVGEADLMPENPHPASGGYAAHAYDEDAEERSWKVSCEAVGVADDD